MAEKITIHYQNFSIPVVTIHSTNIKKISKFLANQFPIDMEKDIIEPYIINVKGIAVTPTFLAQLLEVFRQFDLQVVGIETDDKELAQDALFAGLSVFNERQNQSDFLPEDSAHFSSEALQTNNDSSEQISLGQVALNQYSGASNPMIHLGNVENGEQLYAEHRDLIVLGDVQPQAEIIADGSIYVGGNLQGAAYAGNSGLTNAKQAVIHAYSFEASMVSVAGFYQLKEDMNKSYLGLSVKVSLKQQQFIYEIV